MKTIVGITGFAALAAVALTGCATTPAEESTPAAAEQPAYSPAERAADSTAALAFFRSNIASIHQRDRPAYLEHYLQSPRLTRTGPAGPDYGFEDFAAGDPDSWPDTLIATHFEVTPLASGAVYGVYRYRVVDGGSQRGVSERVMVRQPDGEWKIAVSTAFGSPGDRPVPPTAFTGATVIDGTGAEPVADADLVMRDGEIACVGECEIGDDVHVIDATGKWIMPGLVDGHVHYSQTGWADGRPDATDVRDRFPYAEVQADLRANPERFHRSYLCSGVTAVFDVGGHPWTWSLPDATEQSTSAPHVAAAGPLLSTVEHDILNLPASRQIVPMMDQESARAAAEMVAAHESDAVKVWGVMPPGQRESVRERLGVAADVSRESGIPLIVHATTLAGAKDALRAGAHLLVHSVEDDVVDSEFLELARDAGTFYNPTLTVREGYVELLSREFAEDDVDLECVDPATLRKARLTDSLPPVDGLDVAAYAERAAEGYATTVENLERVHEAGIPIVTGTDAGNPLTLHGPAINYEMEAMVEAGLTPMEVLVASTRNGARAMGREDFGTVEPGMIADLLVLDADPLAEIRNAREVALVVRAGEVWTRGELTYSGADAAGM